jgi:hypothetical protein
MTPSPGVLLAYTNNWGRSYVYPSDSSLERKREKEKNYGFWDMATLVRGNRGEINGKLIIRFFNFDFITINETSKM